MNSKTAATSLGLTLALALASPGLGGGSAASAATIDRGTITRVSIATDGTQSPTRSTISYSSPVVSDRGRFVVFSTEASFDPRDTNGIIDVYRRDLETGRTRLVSVTPRGVVGNDYSHEASISGSGRFVAFTSWATNLTRADGNGSIDVLVKDMRTGRIERVSRTSDGRELHANSFYGVISGNGRYVAFQSFARFGAADTDRREDIYVHDRVTDRTTQASVRSDESDLPAHYGIGGISDDGRFVTFADDNNAWLRDRAAGVTTRVWHERNQPDFQAGTVGRPAISGNGRFVVFSTRAEVNAKDTGSSDDILRYSVRRKTFDVVSAGRRTAVGNGASYTPTISRSGRYVGFVSEATNLVRRDSNGYPDVFIRDMRADSTRLVSHGLRGPANNRSGRSSTASIGRDGQHMVYDSYASNLVRGDTNGDSDVFVWAAPQG